MEDENALRKLKSIGRHFPKLKKEEENKPLRVVVTGAAGQIGSSLCFMIAQGRMLGPYQKVILQLLELPMAQQQLKGLVMELKDGCFPLVDDIIGTDDANVAFKDADVALLVGAKPRGPGMERKDLLNENAKIFKVQGEAIEKHAKKTIKVLVVGNPANTNALICSHYAPSVPKKNFTALTRLDQNRAVSQLSDKLNVKVEDIHNVIIWGNHSLTQYPDVNHSYTLKNNQKQGISNQLEEEYRHKAFIDKVAKRGAEIISVMKKSSVPSAASSAADHIHDWLIGTRPGEYVSMGVISDGNSYGIQTGIIYSFPITCKNGEWSIVNGLQIDQFSKQKMLNSEKELLEERKMALGF